MLAITLQGVETLITNVVEGRYHNMGKGGPEETEAEPDWSKQYEDEDDDGYDEEMENPLTNGPLAKSVDNRVFRYVCNDNIFLVVSTYSAFADVVASARARRVSKRRLGLSKPKLS